MKKNFLVLLGLVLVSVFTNVQAQSQDPSTSAVATGTGVATSGAMAVGGNMNTSISFEAAKTVAPIIGGPNVAGSVPQNFGPPNATANGTGIEMTLSYNNVCKPRAVRGYDTVSRTYEGASGNTEIVFTPHVNYAKTVKKSPPLPWEEAGTSSRGTISVDDVGPVEFGTRGKFKCLGMLKVTGLDKKAGQAAMQTILNDAQEFPMQKMEGFPSITLLSQVSTIAAPFGNSNTGSGYGATSGLGKIFEPVTTAVGFTAAASSGVTFPEQKLGMTIIIAVRVADNDPDGVFIDFSLKQAEQAPVVSQSIGKPVVAESKAGGPQETAVIHNKPSSKPVAKKKNAVQKKVAKSSVSRQATLAVSPQKKEPAKDTVIKCADCIFRGELIVQSKQQ